MKTALTSLALVLSAGAAFAEGPIQGNEVFQFSSSLSRAVVQADAVQANRDGLVARGDHYPVAAPVVTSRRDVAQVRAEAAAAYRLGLMAQGEILPVPGASQGAQDHLAGLRALPGDAVAQSNSNGVVAN